MCSFVFGTYNDAIWMSLFSCFYIVNKINRTIMAIFPENVCFFWSSKRILSTVNGIFLSFFVTKVWTFTKAGRETTSKLGENKWDRGWWQQHTTCIICAMFSIVRSSYIYFLDSLQSCNLSLGCNSCGSDELNSRDDEGPKYFSTCSVSTLNNL